MYGLSAGYFAYVVTIGIGVHNFSYWALKSHLYRAMSNKGKDFRNFISKMVQQVSLMREKQCYMPQVKSAGIYFEIFVTELQTSAT